MTKNKYILIFLIAFFLLFANSFALALEITYPQIPGLPPLTKDSTIGEFVGYYFGLGIYLAGALALISLTIGAIGLITSAENPEASSNAKDRIRGAVLGLVLTLASFIIIRTINPVLITPTLTPLGTGLGVFYYNGSDLKSVPQEVADVPGRSEEYEGYNSLIYLCSDPDKAPALLVWIFPQENFQDYFYDEDTDTEYYYQNTRVERITCVKEVKGTVPNEIIKDIGSFKTAFETPGIYYYLKPECEGFASFAIISSQDNIPEPFKGKIKSVKIINDVKNNIYYGVIFHKQTDLETGGQCSYPIIADYVESKCEVVYDDSAKPVIGVPASAANIFVWNNDPASAGDGATFYSEPYGWDTGAKAGFYNVGFSAIDPIFLENTKDMKYDYDYVDRPGEYKSDCSSFRDCPGSIEIRGDYLVALYWQDLLLENTYCQTFTDDVPNLHAEEFVAVGTENISTAYIIPIK